MLVAAAALVLVAADSAGATPPGPAPGAEVSASQLGVYAGPAAVGKHRQFAADLGARFPYAVDFAGASSGWKDIESPDWLFTAWRGTGYRLVYSVQPFPDSVTRSLGGAAALERCASGGFDSHYRALAVKLVALQLAATVVRPAWEMNGDWFAWSAQGRTSAYVGCFRHIVTSMRAVTGSHFTFNWNPSIGPGRFPAERAYPGDAYVDQVGVDLYDWSWTHGVYDTKATQTATERRAAVARSWRYQLSGDHGLRFWSAFAAHHGKPLTLPEWGLAQRTQDSYGGGDNPYFIQHVLDFISDPVNHVAFAAYFNSTSPDAEHRLVGSSAFPRSAALFRTLVQQE